MPGDALPPSILPILTEATAVSMSDSRHRSGAQTYAAARWLSSVLANDARIQPRSVYIQHHESKHVTSRSSLSVTTIERSSRVRARGTRRWMNCASLLSASGSGVQVNIS
jgi:hypothetical protein